MCFWPCCHITTRKITADGTEQYWTANHGATVWGIAVNSDGYVVTGGLPSPDNMTTRKYDSNGNLLWSKDHGADVYAVAIDDDGNVYSHGPFGIVPTLRKYDPDGALLWSATGSHLPGSIGGVAVDSAGNVYEADHDYLTKYDSTGVQLWRYAPFAVPLFGGIAIDSTDLARTAGRDDGAGNSIRKFTAGGAVTWGYASNLSSQTDPGCVAVDAANNVYIGGVGSSSHCIEKISDGPSNLYYIVIPAAPAAAVTHRILSVSVDPNGLLYGVGAFTAAGAIGPRGLWQFDAATGVLNWGKSLADGTDAKFKGGTCVASDANAVYVGGEVQELFDWV